jgi:predicted RNA binding protein YcfA (HicA-like mRNA interferase family)
MSALPTVSGQQTIKALSKIGYLKDRQHGSHIILRNTSYPYRRLVIPNHKEIAKGTLRAVIKQSGMTVNEFKSLL